MKARIRRLLHCFVADLLYYSGLLAAWHAFRRQAEGKDGVCVLGFHRVLTEAELVQSNCLPGILMKELTFLKLLEYLKERFTIVALDDLIRRQASDSSKPCCLITFDDGWKDNYTRAYLKLKKSRMRATIFLASGLVGGDNSFWVERLCGAWKDQLRREKIQSAADRLLKDQGKAASLENLIEYLKHMSNERRQQVLQQLLPEDGSPGSPHPVDQMLNWDEVIEMSRDGIDFGAHSVTHPLLTHEDDSTVDWEVRLCRQALEEKLGLKVRAFAYPNGSWDDRVRRRIQEAGYECAFTTRQGWHHRGHDPFTIRRILLHEGNVTGRDGQFSPAMFNLALARRR